MTRHSDPPHPWLHRSAASPTAMPRGLAGQTSLQHSLRTAFPHVSEDAWAGYNALILLFSLIAIGMLAVGVVIEITPSTRSLLAYADFTVCLIFLVDFGISLARAEDRWRYLWTWGWVDLLSSIPLFDSLRWGRAARIVRILRVIRGVKATRFLASLIFRNRARNALLAGSFVAVVVVFASSFAVLQFEAVEGGNIKSAEDAIWWAICTVTTVGYGDLYPITWEGRVVAFVLMVTGASSFGALSGFIAGNFIGSSDTTTLPVAQIESPEILRLVDEVAALRADLEARQDHGGRAAA
jgi:voltage-gated potassium channel